MVLQITSELCTFLTLRDVRHFAATSTRVTVIVFPQFADRALVAHERYRQARALWVQARYEYQRLRCFSNTLLAVLSDDDPRRLPQLPLAQSREIEAGRERGTGREQRNCRSFRRP